MASNQKKTKVLVAGATGMMGQKILGALAKKPSATVVGLLRKRDGLPAETAATLTSLEKRGVTFVQGDLTDKSSLIKATEGVDVVVSAVSGGEEATVNGQLNLLAAAKNARVRRFIPSDFSLNFFNLKLGQHVWLDYRLRVAEEVHRSGLEYTHILNGCFTDILFGFLGVYNRSAKTLTYWGTGDQKFDITTTDDVASYTAEAALDPKATGIFPVAGDVVTMKEVAKIYKEVKGQPLKEVVLGTTDDLAKWIEETRAKNPQNPFAYAPQQYLLPMMDGRGKLVNLVNDNYPHIKPMTLREWLKVNDV